ncbi:MAG: HD domain-containing protein [Eisenbergiella sp.]
MRSGPAGCAATERYFQIGAAMERLELSAFIREAERLKNVLRTAWSSEGRQESTAEHSWRLALCAMTAAQISGLDRLKLVEMALLHDMGELYEGIFRGAPSRSGRKYR